MSITITAVAAAALALVAPNAAVADAPDATERSAVIAPESTPTAASASEVASATVAGGSPAADAGTASTGQYDWVCVLTSGQSYSMAHGEALTNCKGSYLQKYLDGRQLEIIHLTPNGTPATWDGDLRSCIISIAGLGGTTVALVLSPPTGIAAWVATGVSVGSGVLSLAPCAG